MRKRGDTVVTHTDSATIPPIFRVERAHSGHTIPFPIYMICVCVSTIPHGLLTWDGISESLWWMRSLSSSSSGRQCEPLRFMTRRRPMLCECSEGGAELLHGRVTESARRGQRCCFEPFRTWALRAGLQRVEGEGAKVWFRTGVLSLSLSRMLRHTGLGWSGMRQKGEAVRRKQLAWPPISVYMIHILGRRLCRIGACES